MMHEPFAIIKCTHSSSFAKMGCSNKCCTSHNDINPNGDIASLQSEGPLRQRQKALNRPVMFTRINAVHKDVQGRKGTAANI